MPSHVRIFFGLVVTLMIYWISSAVWAFVHHRAPTNDLVIHARIISLVIQSLIFFVPAWLAAFHRKNWARWTFAAMFVGLQILALWPFLYLTGNFRKLVLQAYWASLMSPKTIAVTALFLAAIFFVFTGNARAWFKKGRASEKGLG